MAVETKRLTDLFQTGKVLTCGDLHTVISIGENYFSNVSVVYRLLLAYLQRFSEHSVVVSKKHVVHNANPSVHYR